MKLKIGAFGYNLKLVDDLPNASGYCREDSGVIRVSKDQDALHQRETSLHEVLHCIIDQTDVRSLDKEDLEKLVSALSPRLFELVRDNPKFLRWLCE